MKAGQLQLSVMLNGDIRRVAHVTRYSGVPAIRKENVAEHMYFTAQYALLIGRECERRGGIVNFGELLARAVVHDLDEAVVGDLRRDVKYGDTELHALWERLAFRTVRELEQSVGAPFSADWQDAKDDSLEGDILRLADLLSVAAYATEELDMGNRAFCHVLRENVRWLRQWLDGTNPPCSEIRDMANEAIELALGTLERHS